MPVHFDAETVQTFYVGPASCGVPGTAAGLVRALERFGSVPLADLVGPGVRLAREGAPVNAEQAYILEILAPIHERLPGHARALRAATGRPLREGDAFRFPELAEALERFGAEGAEPFYRGEVAAALSEFVVERRRHPRPRRPRRLRGDRAPADPRPVPRRRGADQPAALLGRDPDRLLPRAAGAARRAQRPRAAGRGDGRRQPPPRRASSPRRSTRRGWRPGFLDPGRARPRGRRPARLDHPHLGPRRRRHVRQRHLLERLRLRRARPGHRRDPQQHARRGGPQPARLPPHRAGPAGALDDGPDRGPARRRDRARARQRRLQPDPLGDPADGGAGDRAGHAGRRRRSRRRACTSRRASSRPSRGSTRRRWRGSRRAASPVARWPQINLFFGGVQAVARDPASGALSGGGDPRRGGAVAYAD